MKQGKAVLLPYTKIGIYDQAHDRQWVLRSDNIMTEKDASKVTWSTWPAGDGGASQGCGPFSGGDIAEEGGLLSLGGNNVLYIFRTSNGNANECVSVDDGKTWVERPVRYAHGAGYMKHPRGPLTARRQSDGSYLLLYFNNGWKGYSSAKNLTRNPYFLSMGRLTSKGDDIEWSQPGKSTIRLHHPRHYIEIEFAWKLLTCAL